MSGLLRKGLYRASSVSWQLNVISIVCGVGDVKGAVCKCREMVVDFTTSVVLYTITGSMLVND